MDFEPFADTKGKNMDATGKETDPINIEEGTDKDDTENTNRATSKNKTTPNRSKSVPNPYKPKAKKIEDKDPTPTKGNNTKDANPPITYAQMVAESPQSKLKTHKRIKAESS